jgi:hypothetical protein
MKKKARHAPDRMISGKRRKKAAPPGVAVHTVAVDGIDYAWSQRHGWTVWAKGVRAISLSVSLQPGRTRELILDFTVAVDAQDNTPSEIRLVRALAPAIQAAMAAGWDPESRGRAFRYEVAENV